MRAALGRAPIRLYHRRSFVNHYLVQTGLAIADGCGGGVCEGVSGGENASVGCTRAGSRQIEAADISAFE